MLTYSTFHVLEIKQEEMERSIFVGLRTNTKTIDHATFASTELKLREPSDFLAVLLVIKRLMLGVENLETCRR